jgi:hypothetical protein
MLVCPRIEVNTVKRNPLRANTNLRDTGANVAIEAIFVHAQVAWRVTQPNEAR